jgi:hypothetical protein
MPPDGRSEMKLGSGGSSRENERRITPERKQVIPERTRAAELTSPRSVRNANPRVMIEAAKSDAAPRT